MPLLVKDPQKKLGTIQTKPWVARLIYSLVDFESTRPIEYMSVLDPGCGKGIFLLEALKRSLSRALSQEIDAHQWVRGIEGLFVGYEIDPELCKESRKRVCKFLVSEAKINKSLARSVARRIVIQGDFLKWKPQMRYDVVVGNPPYVRYDNLDREYIQWLRNDYACFRGRADLCVPFMQHGLELLSERGKLAFICTNRFTLCDYGRSLRELISKSFSLARMIDFTAIEPFEDPVATYPWIFVLEHKKDQNVLFSKASNPNLDDFPLSMSALSWSEVDQKSLSADPWRVPDVDLMKLWDNVKRLNPLQLGDREFCVDIKVGLATGADRIFVNPPAEAQIEPELLVPFVLSRNLKEDRRIHTTDVLLNTWDPSRPERPIRLKDWPNASIYLNKNRGKLGLRYVAKKNPHHWYRLIDHLDPQLLEKKKLIFPSLRRKLEVYFDSGTCIPHHNCYFAFKTSEDGPSLMTIGALLSSAVVDDLISVLAIRFNGRASRLLKSSFLEIPMPEPEMMIERGKEFESAFLQDDTQKMDTMARELYGIA